MAIDNAISTQSYTQYAQLPHVLSKANDAAALKQAAQHFESLFIDMWLQSARKATAAFGSNDMVQSNALATHQQMYDHEMAIHMSQHGGVGLAEVIVRQLQGQSALPDSVPQPVQQPAFSLVPAQTVREKAAHEEPAHEKASVQETVTSFGVVDPVSESTALPSDPQTASQVTRFGQRVAAFESPADFVSRLRPIVQAELVDTNLPWQGVLGQAALETGWGDKVIAQADGQLSHNLFGIKSDPNSASGEGEVVISSLEYEGGRWVSRESGFRSYGDWQASVVDYVQKLKNSARYADVMQEASGGVERFAQALSAAGYATDPRYADKIIDIAQRLKEML